MGRLKTQPTKRRSTFGKRRRRALVPTRVINPVGNHGMARAIEAIRKANTTGEVFRILLPKRAQETGLVVRRMLEGQATVYDKRITFIFDYK